MTSSHDITRAGSPRSDFAHAVRWAFVMNGGQQAASACITFILAAMLGPEAFGTVAMAITYIIFIQMMMGQGLGAALVQRRELTDDHLHTAFWMVLAFSAPFIGLSVLLSGWWARMNGLAPLQTVIIALSPLVLVEALTLVPQSVLQRRMDFRRLALRGNAAVVIGGVTGVILAWRGFGIWSLIIQQLTTAAIGMVLLWALTGWRPRFMFSPGAARDLLRFSFGVLGNRLGVFANLRGIDVVLGLGFGPVAVGVYRLAERLMGAVLNVLTRSLTVVALPHFSPSQDDRVELRRKLAQCITLSAWLSVPVLMVTATCSDAIMAIIGVRWSVAAPALQVLCVLGMVRATLLFTGPLLLAVGQAVGAARLVWLLALTNLTIVSFIVLLTISETIVMQVTLVAAAQLAVFTIVYGVAGVRIAHRIAGFTARDFGRAVAVPIGIGALAAGASWTGGVAADSVGAASPAMALLCAAGPGLFIAAVLGVFAHPAVRRRFRRGFFPLRRTRIEPTVNPIGAPAS